MATEKVVFSIANQRYPTLFDRAQLRLGTRVYVTFDAGGKPTAFTTTATPQGIAYYVTWISPSEWYVPLEKEAKVDEAMIVQVEQATGGRVDAVTVERALRNMASKIRPNHMYKTSERRNSKLHSVLAVAERLSLCKRLSQPAVGTVLWAHWQNLCTYLYLTCFDVLGQRDDRMTFDQWLTATSTKNERDSAVVNLDPAADPAAIAKKMHDYYNAHYGVREAFMNFLRNILPPDARKRLLDSLRIERVNNPPNLTTPISDDDTAKEKYLYEVRNLYTHRAGYVGGIHPSQSPQLSGSEKSWSVREQIFKADDWTTYLVCNWPFAVEDAVRDGLAQVLRTTPA